MDRPSETLQGSAWPVLLGTERPGHGLPTGHNNTLGVKAGPLLPHSHLLAVAISHQVATPGQHVAADRKGHRDRQEEPRAPKGRWPIWSGLGSARGPPAPAEAVAGAKGRAGVAHLLGDLQVLLGKSQGLRRAPHGHVGVPQAPACPALAHSAGRETESTSTPRPRPTSLPTATPSPSLQVVRPHGTGRRRWGAASRWTRAGQPMTEWS